MVIEAELWPKIISIAVILIVKLIMVSLLLDMDRLDSIMEMIAFMEEDA